MEIGQLISSAERLELSPELVTAISRSASYVSSVAASERLIYGVNTGFGALCRIRVQPNDLSSLQHNLLRSHACGVGTPVSQRISRTVLLMKILSFRTGHSGVSNAVVQRLVDFWNFSVLPIIPSKGTVGASGDLAPLSHMALTITGEGQLWHQGRVRPAADVLGELGWRPLQLCPKEGLALINGVQYITAVAVDCLLRVGKLIKAADLIASLTIQGFSAARSFFQHGVHEVTAHLERRDVAANLRTLLKGGNHWDLPHCDPTMEDPYSIRCIPQVHGAIRHAYSFACEAVERECNTVSDNPLVFVESEEILTCGNLHGEAIAFAADFTAIAMSELASISERRTYQLLSGQHGLPPFLADRPGVNSGLMVPQYTAAALVNQNKVLASPASIDSIPTCHLQEDHVSMGGTSVWKLGTIVDNCEYVLAIELMTAMQAIDMNVGLILSKAAREIRDEFRKVVPLLKSDRILSEDIEASRLFLLENVALWTVTERLL